MTSMPQQVCRSTKEPTDRRTGVNRWQQVAVTIEQWVETIGGDHSSRQTQKEVDIQCTGMHTMRSCNNKWGAIQKTWFGVPSSKVPGSIKRYF